jgi:[ribosomal protein S18]-alanine N-acetyltransferase
VIHLRGIEKTDLDALAALDRECFRPGIAYSRADLRYYLCHPRSFSVAAEDELGIILGFVIAESYLEEGRGIGHVITVDVAPASRRHGLGRMLMEAVFDHLRASEAAMVRLEVAIDNAAAQAFYQRLGFVRTGRIPGFYPGGLDALIMEKSLTGNPAAAIPPMTP